jgi:hypothetical protein
MRCLTKIDEVRRVRRTGVRIVVSSRISDSIRHFLRPYQHWEYPLTNCEQAQQILAQGQFLPQRRRVGHRPRKKVISGIILEPHECTHDQFLHDLVSPGYPLSSIHELPDVVPAPACALPFDMCKSSSVLPFASHPTGHFLNELKRFPHYSHAAPVIRHMHRQSFA